MTACQVRQLPADSRNFSTNRKVNFALSTVTSCPLKWLIWLKIKNGLLIEYDLLEGTSGHVWLLVYTGVCTSIFTHVLYKTELLDLLDCEYWHNNSILRI